MDLAQIAIAITSDSKKAVAGIKETVTAVKKIKPAAKEASQELGGMGNNMAGAKNAKKQVFSLKDSILDLGKTAAGIFGAMEVIGFLVNEVKATKDFQRAMIDLSFVIEETGDSSERLNEKVKAIAKTSELLATKTGLTKTELIGSAQAAGRLGVAYKDMQHFMETSAMTTALAPDFADSMEEAAGKIAKLKNIFGLTDIEARAMISSLDAVADSSAATGGEIADVALRYSALIVKTGKSREEMKKQAAEALAVAGTLKDLGTNTEVAGSAIAKLVGMMQNSPDKFAKFLENTTGRGKEFSEEIGVNNVKALQLFLGGFENLDPLAKAKAMKEMSVNSVYLADVINKLGNTAGLERLDKKIKTATKGFDDVEKWAKKFEKIQADIGSQISQIFQKIRNIVSSFVVIVGAFAAPFIMLFNDMLEPVMALADGIQAVLVPAFYVISSAITFVISSFGKLLNIIFPFLTTTNEIGDEVGAITTLFKGLGLAIGIVAIAKLPLLISSLGRAVVGFIGVATSSLGAIAGMLGFGTAATASGVAASVAWSPFLIVIGAIATALISLKLAWDNNFLGMQDAIKAVINKLKFFVDVVKSAGAVLGNIFSGNNNQNEDTFQGQTESIVKYSKRLEDLNLSIKQTDSFISAMGQGAGAEENIEKLEQYKLKMEELSFSAEEIRTKLGEISKDMIANQNEAFMSIDEYSEKLKGLGMNGNNGFSDENIEYNSTELNNNGFAGEEGLAAIESMKEKFIELGVVEEEAGLKAIKTVKEISKLGGDIGVSDLAIKLSNLGYPMEEAIKKALKIKTTFQDVKNAVTPYIESMKNTLFSMVGVVSYVGEVIWKSFKVAFDLIKPIISTFWNYFKATFDFIASIVRGFINILTGNFQKGFTQIWNGIKSWVKAFKTAFVSLFSNLANIVFAFGKAFGTAFNFMLKIGWAFLQDLYSNFKIGLSKIAMAVGGLASSMANALFNIKWSGVLDGLQGAIGDALNKAWETVSEWASKVWSMVKNAIMGSDDGVSGTSFNAKGGSSNGTNQNKNAKAEVEKDFLSQLKDSAAQDLNLDNTSRVLSEMGSALNSGLDIDEADMNKRGHEVIDWFQGGAESAIDAGAGNIDLNKLINDKSPKALMNEEADGGGSGGGSGGSKNSKNKLTGTDNQSEKEREALAKEVEDDYKSTVDYVSAKRKMRDMLIAAKEEAKVRISLNDERIEATGENGDPLVDSVQNTADMIANIDMSAAKESFEGFSEAGKKEFEALQKDIESSGEEIAKFATLLRETGGEGVNFETLKEYVEESTEALANATNSVDLLEDAFNNLYLKARDTLAKLKDEISSLKDELKSDNSAIDYEIQAEKQRIKISEAREKAEEVGRKAQEKAQDKLLKQKNDILKEERKLQILQSEGVGQIDLDMQTEKLSKLKESYNLNKSIVADAKNDPSVKLAYEKLDLLTKEEKKLKLMKDIANKTAKSSDGKLTDGADLSIYNELSKLDQLRIDKAIMQKEKQDEIGKATERAASFDQLSKAVQEGKISVAGGIVQIANEEANLSQGQIEKYQQQLDLMQKSNDEKDKSLANEIMQMSAVKDRFVAEEENLAVLTELQKVANDQLKLFWSEEKKIKEEQLELDLKAIEEVLSEYENMNENHRSQITQTKEHNINAIDAVIHELNLQAVTASKATAQWQAALSAKSSFYTYVPPKTEGYKKGGFTGNIGVNDIAGVVHGKEYVIPAHVLQKLAPTGIMGIIERMRGGFKNGGFTSKPPVNLSNIGGNTSNNQSLNVIQNITGGNIMDNWEEIMYRMGNL